MASSAFAIAQAASKVQTAGQLRAAMGVVAQVLREGYDRLSIFGSSTSVPNLVEGTRDAAFSLLDTVNRSAQILYGIYPADADLQEEEISTSHALSAAHVIAEANDAVKAVEDYIGTIWSNLAQLIIDAIEALGQIVAVTLQTATKAIAAGSAALIAGAWPVLLLIGFGVAIFFWARGRALKALVGV